MRGLPAMISSWLYDADVWGLGIVSLLLVACAWIMMDWLFDEADL